MGKNAVRLIKMLDIIVQLAIGTAALAGAFKTSAELGLIFLLGWQLLSMAFHLAAVTDQPLRRARIIWGTVFGIYAGLIAITFISIILLLAALILTGLAGVFFTLPYFIISVTELVQLQQAGRSKC